MRSTARTVLGVALTAGAVIALAGCSAGQVATTGEIVSAVDGASARVKQVEVRDATIAFPAGSAHRYTPGQSAPLDLTVANSGGQPDRIVSVTTPAAKRVVLSGTTVVPGRAKIAARADGKGEFTATLQDLTTTVQSGPIYDVTFTFEHAGSVTLAMPVGSPSAAG